MAKKLENTIDEVLAVATSEKLPIDEMPLETLRDYRLYNEAARKENHKLKICRYQIKPCPVDLHPKQKVIFRSNDQPTNPQKVFLSNDKIHYDETLIPGQTYELPEIIVHHLSNCENPQWGWVDGKDGAKETFIKNKVPRFSLTPVYEGIY